ISLLRRGDEGRIAGFSLERDGTKPEWSRKRAQTGEDGQTVSSAGHRLEARPAPLALEGRYLAPNQSESIHTERSAPSWITSPNIIFRQSPHQRIVRPTAHIQRGFSACGGATSWPWSAVVFVPEAVGWVERSEAHPTSVQPPSPDRLLE